eukprot:353033-Chlamydomonas_euryale.AAC.11
MKDVYTVLRSYCSNSLLLLLLPCMLQAIKRGSARLLNCLHLCVAQNSLSAQPPSNMSNVPLSLVRTPCSSPPPFGLSTSPHAVFLEACGGCLRCADHVGRPCQPRRPHMLLSLRQAHAACTLLAESASLSSSPPPTPASLSVRTSLAAACSPGSARSSSRTARYRTGSLQRS